MTGKKAPKKTTVKKATTVKMERKGASVEVHPEKVDNFLAAGWAKCP
tara:strand:- start:2895 stop:3035 length:141 start_codon:yes stop_codon:yes gene_type:complete